MLSSRARAAARLELDALGWSIRVSFDDRIFRDVWVWLSYLAPFPGIVPTIRSPRQVVTSFTPFTGYNSLPAIVLGTSVAVLPWPLNLLYHVCISGFGSYLGFPPRHPLDFASHSRSSTSIVSTTIRRSAPPSRTPGFHTDPGHMSPTHKAVP